MDNQEVIKTLRELRRETNDSWYEEVYDMAISALEKQIPKKVRITTSTKRCATCGRKLSGIGNIHPRRNYCQGCGQAIDWTEGE